MYETISFQQCFFRAFFHTRAMIHFLSFRCREREKPLFPLTHEWSVRSPKTKGNQVNPSAAHKITLLNEVYAALN